MESPKSAPRTRKSRSASEVPAPAATPAPAPAPSAAPGQPPTPWERYQLANHKDRPRSTDYIAGLFTEFTELAGDRNFRDDAAVLCGTARFEDRPVVVIGQEISREVKDRQRRNFGMMHPEGYRKAMRVMNLGSRFSMPVLVLIDTLGAYPGTGAEERGQAEAIARNIRDMFKLKVPVICTVIGSGASGGALGVGLGDRVLMMENAWYNVISPEGCAAILWEDRSMAPRAAEVLKITSKDVLELGVIDEIVPEPEGGAHLDHKGAIEALRAALRRNLDELLKLPHADLIAQRFQKYRRMGVFRELPA